MSCCEIMGFASSLLQQHKLPPSFITVKTSVSMLFKNSKAERRARGISMYQLLSDLLHRPWWYSNQGATAYEADALSTRVSLRIPELLAEAAWLAVKCASRCSREACCNHRHSTQSRHAAKVYTRKL